MNETGLVKRLLIFNAHIITLYTIHIYYTSNRPLNIIAHILILILYLVVSFFATDGIIFYISMYKNYKKRETEKREFDEDNIIIFNPPKRSLFKKIINRIFKKPKC